jgi:hypothetical protein
MFQYLLLVLSLVSSLIACVKVSDIESSDPTTPKAAGVSVIALAEPNRYQVLLPMIEEAQVFQRELVGESEFRLDFLPMLVQGSDLVDQSPIAGALYNYQIGLMKEGAFQVLSTFNVRIPQDLVVDGPLSFTENTQWHQYQRVFLRHGSRITTNGFNLSVKAFELISEDSVIETFPASAQAEIGLTGRNGGVIGFELQNAKGNLQVNLRGETGGAGADGAVYDSPPRPPYPCYDYADFDPNGARGQRGQNGMRGGNSGQLSIQISQGHSLVVYANREVGLGGPGGAGGPGQPGGFKGVSSGKMECMVTQQGKNGEAGEPGQNGAMGIYEKFCLKDLNGVRCD